MKHRPRLTEDDLIDLVRGGGCIVVIAAVLLLAGWLRS